MRIPCLLVSSLRYSGNLSYDLYVWRLQCVDLNYFVYSWMTFLCVCDLSAYLSRTTAVTNTYGGHCYHHRTAAWLAGCLVVAVRQFHSRSLYCRLLVMLMLVMISNSLGAKAEPYGKLKVESWELEVESWKLETGQSNPYGRGTLKCSS